MGSVKRVITFAQHPKQNTKVRQANTITAPQTASSEKLKTVNHV